MEPKLYATVMEERLKSEIVAITDKIDLVLADAARKTKMYIDVAVRRAYTVGLSDGFAQGVEAEATKAAAASVAGRAGVIVAAAEKWKAAVELLDHVKAEYDRTGNPSDALMGGYQEGVRYAHYKLLEALRA